MNTMFNMITPDFGRRGNHEKLLRW